MFTGIIEEIGHVKELPPAGRAGRIVISAATVLEGTAIGDSICVNGVCLTVVELGFSCFAADVMPETLTRSALGSLRLGSPVDLERAMPAYGRFGGHIVSGHIDGVGIVLERHDDQNAVRVRIGAAPEVLALIVDKGSIAVDGVSLTVIGVDERGFGVSLIPHTGEQTVILLKQPGDAVNLENDIVAKYVRRLLPAALGQGNAVSKAASRGGLTLESLIENGF